MSSSAEFWVAVMRVHLAIPGARSLKDRRQVVRSLRDRIINRFNVACADVSKSESWSRAVLGLTAVSNDRAFLQGLLDDIERYARNDPNALAGSFEKDVFNYGE
jgi:uncharacterized protein YlxP (DUF503 family)